MPLLEVRCCCNPAVLIGFLSVDRPTAQNFRRVMTASMRFTDAPPAPAACGWIDIELGDVHFPSGQEYIAVKGNEIPIETWRRVPGFIEATEMQKAYGAEGRVSV